MNKQALRHFLHRQQQRLTAMPLMLLLSLLLVLALLSQLNAGFRPWWLVFFFAIYLLVLALASWRTGRMQWRDAWRFRQQTSKKSLLAMAQGQSWQTALSANSVLAKTQQFFDQHGFVLQKNFRGKTILLSMMKGKANRLGFILAHAGFLLLTVGVILDSELRQVLSGPDNGYITGQLNLPHEATGSRIQLENVVGDRSYNLPFLLQLKGVELVGGIRSLQTAYRSQILIDDPRRLHKREVRLAVNEPTRYQGYDIYQQQIMDGGSQLKLRIWPLFRSRMSALKMNTQVGKGRDLQTGDGPIELLFEDFSPRQVDTVQNTTLQQQVYRNTGPRLLYKASLPDGQTYDYLLYMLPLQQQGRYFFLSGVRKPGNADYRYLHIPADPNGDVQRFLQFHAKLNDEQALVQVVRQTVNRNDDTAGQAAMVDTMLKTIRAFNHGGYSAMQSELSHYATADKLPGLMELTNKLMRNVFYQLYEQVLQAERGNVSRLSSFDIHFFDDALLASAELGEYGLPFYIQLDDFDYHPAVQLKVVRKPGKYVFFIGGVILLLGMALMLYTRHRRCWLLIEQTESGQQLIFAGMGNRQQEAFAIEFAELAKALAKRVEVC